MVDPNLKPVGEYTKIADMPLRRHADTILLTPTRPNADTPTRFCRCVGIVRVFYRTLRLHKGAIADYNL